MVVSLQHDSVKQYNCDNSPNKNNFWFLFCWFPNDCRAARTLYYCPQTQRHAHLRFYCLRANNTYIFI